jgi:predicted SAM-dependent methyltransferase
MRRLHIGGQVRVDGWEVLDANAGPAVDHVADARDLSQFSDETFDIVYASHVVEHLDYRDVLLATLREWRRVMVPGGTLYVSVPDLATLASMFVLKDQLNMEERYHVMRMIFGGHVDSHDYHLVGLDQEFLGTFLTQAGFCNLRRVRSFGLFQDTSEMLFKGIPISLNVIAEKPA